MHFFSNYYLTDKFDSKEINKLDKKTIIIYRNYRKNFKNLSLLKKLKNFCKKKNLKLILSNNFKLALNLKLDGAYIPSFNKSVTHLNYSLYKNFMTIGSAHNIKEIRIKERQEVDQIVLSSLFKKNKNYLGLYRFKTLKNLTRKNIIVLGGITKKNQKKIKLVNCNSFAGITYFKKKAPTN
jgi:thiamine-phosphate pyrophosphorylase